MKKKGFFNLFLAYGMLIAVSFFLCPLIVNAVKAPARPDYAAEKYSKIKEIEMAPGEVRKIKIGFYNRGSYNWRNSGKNYVSLYTYQPKYRSSVFYSQTWRTKTQPAKMKDSLTGPGQLGYFEFELKAPQKIGVYKEKFALAAENKTWINGGQFELVITVKKPTAKQTDDTGNGDISETLAQENLLSPPKVVFEKKDYEAMRLSRVDALKLLPWEESSVTVMFLNKGKKSWNSRSLVLNNVAIATVGVATTFATESWQESGKILTQEGGAVKTGQTEIYTIPLRAPLSAGIYTLHINLLIDGKRVDGGTLDLPITVTDPNPLPIVENIETISTEPTVRIGLFTTEEPVKVSSPFVYKITTADGRDFGLLNPGEVAVITFDETAKNYSIAWAGVVAQSTASVRLVPQSANSYFTLVNFENRPRWNTNYNDNEFRGALEVSFAEKTGYTWVINELPMEQYLKGLSEAGNSSPPEFQKALLTAARSYAYYNWKNPTKHAAANFTLDAANDQVYRGYGEEKRDANCLAAIDATSGMVVTYNGEPVYTPYFGRSNGKTKSFKAVWGREVPWLQSVAAPYDKGQTFWGHGVGMSARDAIYRAKDGASWEDIIKYYYTGVELQKMY